MESEAERVTMARKPANGRFVQSDITRVYRGAAAAGVRVIVEIDINGTIRAIPLEGANDRSEAESAIDRMMG